MKRILIGMIAVMMAMPVFAEDTPAVGDKTTTSQPYVKTQVDLKQGLIPAAGTNSALGETVVTYTANGEGEIGERGIYTGGTYDASTDADKLITASALNTAFTTLPETDTTTLECANPGTCTLWTIVDQTAYGESITLPAGYTRLAYIESTGTQWIDTGVKLTSADVIYTEFKNSSASAYGALYGVYKLGQSSAFYGNGTYYAYNVDNTKVNTGVAVDTNWHSVTHDFIHGSLVIDNSVSAFDVFDFSNDENNYLFARYYNDSYGYYFSGAIKQYKITRNGNVILDLIPVSRDNNGSAEVGMYDIVNNRFYQKQGTGNFIAGPAVN